MKSPSPSTATGNHSVPLTASAAPCSGANASACAGAGCCFYPANSQHVSRGYGRIAWPWPAHTYNERRPGTVEVLLFW